MMESTVCFTSRLAATGDCRLETNRALDQFLMSVEKRALRMATISTGNADDALDVVQDAMMSLARRYGSRKASEWGGLFHRILQNSITDFHRRNQVRNRWKFWFTSQGADLEEVDPIQTVADPVASEPSQQLQHDEAINVLEQAIQQLPLRQQQAFMLRLWEGLSVAETATAMNCSQGSVKTHYSRALRALRDKLKGVWP